MSSNMLNNIALIIFLGSFILGLVLTVNAQDGGFVMFCYSIGGGLFCAALLAGIVRVIELLEQIVDQLAFANKSVYSEQRKANYPEKGKDKNSYLEGN